MASAFDIDVAKLQTELAELISRNDNMNCRIDSHNKVIELECSNTVKLHTKLNRMMVVLFVDSACKTA